MTSPAFPAALDALANPGPTTETDDTGFELDVVVARLQNCVMAIENKLGIGTGGPPATAAVLRRTATGTSLWGQLAPGDIAPGAIAPADIAAGTTWTQIASAVGTGASGVISFSAVPQTYSELLVFVRGQVTGASGFVSCGINFEASPVVGSYFYNRQFSIGTSVAAQENLGTASPGFVYIGGFPGASGAAALQEGVAWVRLPNYASPTYAKVVRAEAFSASGLTTGTFGTDTTTGFFYNGAAITLIRLIVTTAAFWTAGTRVQLLGR